VQRRWLNLDSSSVHIAITVATATVLLCFFSYLFFFSYKNKGPAKIILWSWTIIIVASLYWTFRRSTEIYIDDFSLVVISCLSITSTILLRYAFRTKRNFNEGLPSVDGVLNIADEHLEKERQMLANILHDEVNPNLILSRLSLERMGKMLDRLEDSELKSALQKTVDQIAESNSTVYKKLREIITNSRHEILYSMGLTTALESLVSHYQAMVDKPIFRFDHKLPAKPPISNESAKVSYMVVQEALLNIIKHAHASEVTVSALIKGKALNISVIDDGVGIPKLISNESYGVLDMRRRLAKINVPLVIRQIPSGGTAVEFSVPIQD